MYGFALVQPRRWGFVRRALGVWLLVALTLGAGTMPELWAATFFVNVATGDDTRTAAVAQSAATPWQTITKAINEGTLAAGDTIMVAAGTYDALDDGGIPFADTETFPLFLVSGVAIVGAGAGSTIVRGPAAGTDVFFNLDTPLVATTRLSAMTLASDDLTLSAEGVELEQSVAVTMSPEIDNVTFDASLQNGVFVDDEGTADSVFDGLIRNNTFNVDDDGVQFDQTSSGGGVGNDFSPTIRDNTFANGDDGILVNISSGGGEGTISPIIRSNTFTNGDDGIAIIADFSPFTNGDVTIAPLISTNTFTSVGEDAIDIFISNISIGSGDTFTLSPTVVNNTITTPGAFGVEIDVSNLSSGHFVSTIVIAGNTISDPVFDGINFDLSSFSDDIDIDWTIANNTISSPGNGIRIDVSENSDLPSGTFDLTVTGNTVTGATFDGIFFDISSMSSMTGSASFLVAGNTVTGSGDQGIELDISSLSSLTTLSVEVRDNVADGNEDGIAIDVDDFSPNPTEVTCNTATSNTDDGMVQSPGLVADYGGGNLASPGLNTLTGNTDFDFLNFATGSVMAESNFWGTTVAATIDSNISDDEEATGGAVDFTPFLSAAPTVILDAPLVDAVAVDSAPTGASVGDEIEYTATVDADGQCGCASVVFTAPIPANAAVVAASVTTTQGQILDEDPVTVRIGHLPIVGPGVTITWRVIPSSGTSISTQGSLTCTQIPAGGVTDDPATGAPDDPTVTGFVMPGTLQFSAPTYSVSEAGPLATITVTRTGGTDGAVSVSFTTGNGSATEPADYALTAGSLSWLDGDGTPKTFDVPIVDDLFTEVDETVNLTLSAPLGGAALGIPSTAVLTILDNDGQSVLEIPTLNPWGMALLVVSLLCAGWWLLRRRPRRGMTLLLLVGLLFWPVTTGAGTVRPAPPGKARAGKPPLVAGVVQAEVQGDRVLLRLADGGQVVVGREAVVIRGKQERARDPRVKSAASAAAAADSEARQEEREAAREEERERLRSLSIESLAPGAPMVARVTYASDGSVARVKVTVYASLQAAQAPLAKPAERMAGRTAPGGPPAF